MPALSVGDVIVYVPGIRLGARPEFVGLVINRCDDACTNDYEYRIMWCKEGTFDIANEMTATGRQLGRLKFILIGNVSPVDKGEPRIIVYDDRPGEGGTDNDGCYIL